VKIAYVNTYYNPESTSGGNAHIGQFITNTVALGHEVWSTLENQHPAVKHLPSGRLARLQGLRSMDVIYTRIEWFPPGPARWAIPPYRNLLGSPLTVWEFNTVPEFGLLRGASQAAVAEAITNFQRYGAGCDLAICVSETLTGYARDQLGLKHVLTVPNGSDPDLFRPDCSPVRRVQFDSSDLKVLWMGSAYLPWHDFELLRNAADYLWETHKRYEVSFHIIGQGLEKLRDMPPNVNYYGPEYYEQLPHWLSAMDVGLALYKVGPGNFGPSLKLFDYMASGLAVIATTQAEICDIFAELGQCDWVLKTDEPKELADLLLTLAQDRQRVKQQGAAARDLVVHKYNWRASVARILDEIEVLLKNR
jgi:glycosyltransferase involved in cell wall biosynthesis